MCRRVGTHPPYSLRTGQDRTGQDRTGQDEAPGAHLYECVSESARLHLILGGQYRTGQDRTGQDRAGQGRAGQGRTGQDRTGQPALTCMSVSESRHASTLFSDRCELAVISGTFRLLYVFSAARFCDRIAITRSVSGTVHEWTMVSVTVRHEWTLDNALRPDGLSQLQVLVRIWSFHTHSPSGCSPG